MWGSLEKSDAPMSAPSGRSLHRGLSLLDRAHDVLVTGATADVAVELLTDLGRARIRMALAQVDRSHQHAGRAEAALQAMAVLERGLHGMQGAIGSRKAFD